jgi:hypothetical protein
MAAVFFSINLFAQAPPQKITYQFVARNSQNQLIQNNAIGMRISILQGSATGSAVYVETHTPQTNGNGTATIEVGAGTVVSGVFALIDWSSGIYFLKTEVDPKGQKDYTISGTSQLLSVPYALYAGKSAIADSIKGGIKEKDPSFINSVASGITSNDTARWNRNTKNKHYIGEYFGGGIIFYLWTDSIGEEHGMIISLNDLSKSQQWSNISGFIRGDGEPLSKWNGMENTLLIASKPGITNSAAKLCLDYSFQGYDDWYLPSCYEMTLIINNLFHIEQGLNKITGASTLKEVIYWTSSEFTDCCPFMFLNTENLEINSNYDKTEPRAVRAIRKF